jgi:hypothetical protein
MCYTSFHGMVASLLAMGLLCCTSAAMHEDRNIMRRGKGRFRGT